jgi:hypothetical protein
MDRNPPARIDVPIGWTKAFGPEPFRPSQLFVDL